MEARAGWGGGAKSTENATVERTLDEFCDDDDYYNHTQHQKKRQPRLQKSTNAAKIT